MKNYFDICICRNGFIVTPTPSAGRAGILILQESFVFRTGEQMARFFDKLAKESAK